MLVETSRAYSFLSQFSRVLKHSSKGVSRLLSTALPEKHEDSNEDSEEQRSNFDKFRVRFPEFLPLPNPKTKNLLREKLERKDMLMRRSVLYIPEFYVGSVLSVTTSNQHNPEKLVKFVGICIMRNNQGLRSTFLLRNIIENQGVEILYSLYSPLIQNITVLVLEKRLDNPLFYLRDAPQIYSTFSFDMLQEYHDPDKPVPINTLKVPLNPRPWLQRYERMDLKGVILPEISEKLRIKAEKSKKPWEEYDIMDNYRKIIPEEDQRELYLEVKDDLQKYEKKQIEEKRKKVFVKPTKQKLF